MFYRLKFFLARHYFIFFFLRSSLKRSVTVDVHDIFVPALFSTTSYFVVVYIVYIILCRKFHGSLVTSPIKSYCVPTTASEHYRMFRLHLLTVFTANDYSTVRPSAVEISSSDPARAVKAINST